MSHELEPLANIPVEICFGGAEDVNDIVELGARMHAESAYAFLPYNRDKVRRLVKSYLNDPAESCVLVVHFEGRVVGMLMGYLSEYDFCDATVASDTVLYVAPEHRSWRAAAGLIRAFRRWAVAHGARELCLGISSAVQTARTAKLYERIGLTCVGGTFKQRLEQTESPC